MSKTVKRYAKCAQFQQLRGHNGLASVHGRWSCFGLVWGGPRSSVWVCLESTPWRELLLEDERAAYHQDGERFACVVIPRLEEGKEVTFSQAETMLKRWEGDLLTYLAEQVYQDMLGELIPPP